MKHIHKHTNTDTQLNGGQRTRHRDDVLWHIENSNLKPHHTLQNSYNEHEQTMAKSEANAQFKGCSLENADISYNTGK